MLKLARMYADNRLYAKARLKLKELVKEHPDAPATIEGKKLLKEIGSE